MRLMKLRVSRKATNQLKKLKNNQQLIERLRKALNTIRENPYSGKILNGIIKEIRSYRVGDWQILYRIYKDQLVILVVNIADRKEVYK